MKKSKKKVIKKKVIKKKVASKNPTKEELANAQLLKQLQIDLRKLCAGANQVSILHLAIAISSGYRFYLTADPILTKKAKTILKKYKVRLCKDSYEVTSYLNSEKAGKSPVEFYL